MSHAANGASRSAFSAFFEPKRYTQSTGVSVSATIVEAINAMMNDTPSGTNILPSMPDSRNSGVKLAIITSEELKMGVRTSAEA